MPTLVPMFRHYIHANNETYDLWATIHHILVTYGEHPRVQDAANDLRRCAFTRWVPDFLVDVSPDRPNTLMCLDIWMATYGVLVNRYTADLDSLGDSTIESWTDDELPDVGTLTVEGSPRSVVQMVENAHDVFGDEEELNPEVVASFLNLRYGWPETMGNEEEAMEADSDKEN